MSNDFDFRHGLDVARLVMGTDAKLVALLHDAVEDGVCSMTDLEEAMPLPVLGAISLLTRRANHSYAEYIDRLDNAKGYAGFLARQVKLADLTVNLARMDDDHRSLEPRYVKARDQLAEMRYRS